MPSLRTYLTIGGLALAALGGFALYRNAGGIADWFEATGRNLGQRLGTIPNIIPSFTAGAPIDIWGSLFGSGAAEPPVQTPAPPGTQPPEDFMPPAVIDPADSRTWPPGYVPPEDQDFLPPPAVPPMDNPDPEETEPGPVPMPPNQDPEETEPGPVPMPPNQDPEETRNLYEAIFEARPNYESYSDPLQNRLLSNFFRSQGFGSELDALYSRYGNFDTFSAGLQNRLLENRARSIGV